MEAKFSVRPKFVVVAAVLCIACGVANDCFSQDIFGGRGIRGDSSPGSIRSPFGSPRPPVEKSKASNPLAGVFKKPAFLDKLKAPSFKFKKPEFKLFEDFQPPTFKKPEFKSPFAGLSKPDPGAPSFFDKMKAKTDELFGKSNSLGANPAASEGSMLADSDRKSTWEAVRNDMERIHAQRKNQPTPPVPPVRSARRLSGQAQRY